ncbi:MAG: hypothetical protein JEZ10_02725 [Verrucomicrobia bacterium]|nr:hypothetical protein [Verrucomicrobiota bacterium]
MYVAFRSASLQCLTARVRGEGGTRPGLSVVKHIAQAHDGTLSVESTLGKGFTFSIFLPVA